MRKAKQKQGEKNKHKGSKNASTTNGLQGTKDAALTIDSEAKSSTWGDADRRIWKRLKPLRSVKSSTAILCEALGQFGCEAGHSGTRDGLVRKLSVVPRGSIQGSKELSDLEKLGSWGSRVSQRGIE